jgi:hypothetical protein
MKGPVLAQKLQGNGKAAACRADGGLAKFFSCIAGPGSSVGRAADF